MLRAVTFPFLLFACLPGPLAGALVQDGGYRIEVSVDGYEADRLRLIYPLLDRLFVVDSAGRTAQGTFVFEGTESLPPGLYSIVLDPDDTRVGVVIDESDQEFAMSTALGDPVAAMTVEGSSDNALFYSFSQFVRARQARAASLRALAQDERLDEARRSEAAQDLAGLEAEVEAERDRLVGTARGSLAAALIAAGRDVEVPEIEGPEPVARARRLEFARTHWFDHIDLGDPRLLRTERMFRAVDEYVNQLHPQHPDTLASAIDAVLEQVARAPETFQAYLVHFVNTAARSTRVGMDALYVHLVLEYYAAGRAPWLTGSDLESVVERARALEPLLIGRPAPDFEVRSPSGDPTGRLSSIQEDFTLLVFWRPDSEVALEALATIQSARTSDWEGRVRIVGICTTRGSDADSCRDSLESGGLTDWLRAGEPSAVPGILRAYDIRAVPQIYLLGADREILSKKFSPEVVGAIMADVLSRPARGG